MSQNTTTTEPTMLDELFTELREALEAQHQAGYLRGQYTAGATGVGVQASMLGATAKADELTASLWRKLYDVAPAFADALTVLDAVRGLEVQL